MRPSSPAPSRGRAALRAAVAVPVAVGALLAGAGPALAHPSFEPAPTLPTDLTYSSTDNVEYLGRFPEHTGTAGGFPSEDGKTYFLSDPRGIFAYDTTKPEAPVLRDVLPLFQQTTGAALAQEDPDSDGKILLVDAATTPVGTAALQVVDVSNPGDLKVLGSVGVTDHTWTCVTEGTNGCAFAYGRTGHIVDLRTPTAPKLLPGSWRTITGFGNPYTHDLTEIRPGLVMSAGSANLLMDTRDPAKPVALNTMTQTNRFTSLGYHSVEWAKGGTDDVLVVGTEIAPSGTTNTAGSDCKGENSVIETWDASTVAAAVQRYFAGELTAGAVRATKFTKIDAYSVSGRGLFLDGAAPAHVLYCAHWMEQHPDFDNGGLLAVSYYDRGTRFLQVGEDGKMTEKGWIVAAEGYSGSVQWVSDDIAYISDYRRGMEVVRLKPTAATGVVQLSPSLIAPGSALASLPAASFGPGSGALAAGGAAVLGLLVLNVATLRRRRVAATA